MIFRCLGSPGYFGSLGINPPAIQRVVDDLADGRNVRIHVHPVASGQMTMDAFGSDFACGSGQFRKPPGLNMVNSLEPLSQRQALVKIHDSLSLLINKSN